MCPGSQTWSSSSEASPLDEEIRAAAGAAPLVRLVPDFEAAAGLGSHEDKVFRPWRRFSASPAGAIPTPLREIVRRTVALVG